MDTDLSSDSILAYARTMLRVQHAEHALLDAILWLADFAAKRSNKPIPSDSLKLLVSDPWVNGTKYLFELPDKHLAHLVQELFDPFESSHLALLGRTRDWLTREVLVVTGARTDKDVINQQLILELNDYAEQFGMVEGHLRSMLTAISARYGGNEESLTRHLKALRDSLVPGERFDVTESERLSTSERRIRDLALYLALGLVAQKHGSHEAASSWYRRGLQAADSQDDRRSSAQIRYLLGQLELSRHNLDAAREWYDSARVIMEGTGDDEGVAVLNHSLGMVARRQRNYGEAAQRFHIALQIEERLMNHRNAGIACLELAWIAVARRMLNDARDWHHRALERFERIADQDHIAYAYEGLGDVYRLLAEYDEAGSWYDKALRFYEQSGDIRRLAPAYLRRGVVAQEVGHDRGAGDWYRRALHLFERLGDVHRQAEIYERLGEIERQRDHFLEAKELYRQALSRFEQVGHRAGEFRVRRRTEELRRQALQNDDTRNQDRTLGTPQETAKHVVVTPQAGAEGGQVAGSSVRVVATEVERLHEEVQREVISRLPNWMRDLQATEVVRLVVNLRIDASLDQLSDFFIEEQPAALRVSLLHAALKDAEEDLLAAVALYPSGAVRTVGRVLIGHDGEASLQPFDYWSLIDPDDEGGGEQVPYRLKLDLVGIGLSP